jgi:hypothetical protein
MKCTECKYCVEADYGYSNYTVEGTDCDCLLGKNPKFPIDRFYDEEPVLKFAKMCKSFMLGDSVKIDCEQEDIFPDNYSDDPEIRSLLKKWDDKKYPMQRY